MSERAYLEIVEKLMEINKGLNDAMQTADVNIKNIKIATLGLEVGALQRELLNKSLFAHELDNMFK